MQEKDIILTVETDGKTETGLLLDMDNYKKQYLAGKKQEEADREQEALEDTKATEGWAGVYKDGKKSRDVKYCRGKEELQQFLSGHFADNKQGFHIDRSRSTPACLEAAGLGPEDSGHRDVI